MDKIHKIILIATIVNLVKLPFKIIIMIINKIKYKIIIILI